MGSARVPVAAAMRHNRAHMRVFSGIRATGDKTLGNYSGGFRQYVATQEEATRDGGEAFFCVVDLHSITTPTRAGVLRESTLSVGAWLFATGLDPQRSTVFVQSHVTAHAEAAWLLGAVTAYGELRRMTQFKEKSEGQDFVSAGLFNYPVLMAGDILLYQADVVPIGDDQRQHLELTRNVADRFNQRFGQTFTIPRGVYPTEGARVRNLQEPERLMSTSRGAPAGVVRLVDAPDEIRRKFKTAVTDSGREIVHDPKDKPGISNLIEILAVATGERSRTSRRATTARATGSSSRTWATPWSSCCRPSSSAMTSCALMMPSCGGCCAMGADKARDVARPTIELMYERMGFAR